MTWQEDVRATVVRRDDEHIIGTGFDQIGDLAKPVPGLVEDLEPHHLIEKVLVRGKGAGIGAADPQRCATQPLDGLGSRNALKSEQCVASMQPRAQDRARSRLVAEVEALDRQQMRGIIGLQADLELPAHPVRSEDRADRQPDALERGAGIGTGRVREARRHSLPGVSRWLPLGRLGDGLWAARIKIRNRGDRAGAGVGAMAVVAQCGAGAGAESSMWGGARTLFRDPAIMRAVRMAQGNAAAATNDLAQFLLRNAQADEDAAATLAGLHFDACRVIDKVRGQIRHKPAQPLSGVRRWGVESGIFPIFSFALVFFFIVIVKSDRQASRFSEGFQVGIAIVLLAIRMIAAPGIAEYAALCAKADVTRGDRTGPPLATWSSRANRVGALTERRVQCAVVLLGRLSVNTGPPQNRAHRVGRLGPVGNPMSRPIEIDVDRRPGR